MQKSTKAYIKIGVGLLLLSPADELATLPVIGPMTLGLGTAIEGVGTGIIGLGLIVSGFSDLD